MLRKHLLAGVVLAVITVFSSCASDKGVVISSNADVHIVSLNVHYLVPQNDKTNWEGRKYALSSMLNELAPDIMLFQEMETFGRGHMSLENLQLDWVLETVPGYTAAAVGEPSQFPITQPILYRSNEFEVVDQGFFFFSETPDVIYSRSFDGRFPAFTSWVLLREVSSSREFYVYNTHLDAFSRENRIKSAQLIVSRMRGSHIEAPVILGGDFNVFRKSPVMRTLEGSGLEIAPVRGSSFHFQKGIHLYPAIDHILFSSEFELSAAAIVGGKWEGEWPSDHHALSVGLNWRD